MFLGILGTTRIALNDNLLKQCTVPEIRAVMAHEMGHYVLNHGAKLLTCLGIFILIGFALTLILFDAAVRRWGDRWGVRGIADPAGLPLLALIFCTLLSLLATPFSTPWCALPSVKRTLLGSTPHVSPMGWQRWRLNLAPIASSTRRRSRNSFFTIIPVAAHGFAWRWIGKQQIYLRGNSNLKIQNKPWNNSVNPSRGDAAKARQQWQQTCPFGLTSDYECKSANSEDRRGCRLGRA